MIKKFNDEPYYVSENGYVYTFYKLKGFGKQCNTDMILIMVANVDEEDFLAGATYEEIPISWFYSCDDNLEDAIGFIKIVAEKSEAEHS